MTREYQSFDAFFPYYLKEHAKPETRALHYIGTALVIVVFTAALITLNPLFVLAMPVAGYFFAWVGHFIVEKNRPATFTYPLWSLMGDFKMFFLAMTGRLGPYLKQAGINPR